MKEELTPRYEVAALCEPPGVRVVVKIKKLHPDAVIPVPKHIEDISGRRYGRLIVIGFAGIDKNHKSVWLCKCDCGRETLSVKGQLTSGMKKSCGCLALEVRKRHYSSIVTKCVFCGKEIRVKKSQYDKGERNYCSRACLANHRKILMTGERNHQYGLKGRLNASFTSDEIPRRNNRLVERMIYVGEWHRDSINGRVKLHRLLVEQNYQLFNSDFFEEIDGWHYLKKGIEVHHKDFDHNNNELPNLLPMAKSEHCSLHNKHRMQKRDKNSIKNDTE